MKIGIDGRLWSESGVGRYIKNLVLGFATYSSDHEFIVFLHSKDFDNVHFSNKAFTKVRADVRWHTLSEQWRFKRIIEKFDIDLMHFPYFSYPIFYRKPFVITIHDLIVDHYPTGKASSLPSPLYRLKHYAYKKTVSAAVKNSKKIIVPTEATQVELIKHYNAKKENISVIHEGFDPSIFSSKGSKTVSSNYILYVGNAYPHKNLERLLKAYEHIRKQNEIDLVCVGRDDFFYRRLEKNKTKGMHFLHNVADSELFDYYTNARLLIMPTLMEGFGLPVLEAMSLSCPVVCSNVGALREIAGDAAVFCDPQDIGSIANAIEKVLKDDGLRRQLIEKGLRQSGKFSWDECVKKTISVYESCDSV